MNLKEKEVGTLVKPKGLDFSVVIGHTIKGLKDEDLITIFDEQFRGCVEWPMWCEWKKVHLSICGQGFEKQLIPIYMPET